MRSIKEKKERALGTKLFLKGERCSSPKCVTVRHPARPGAHGTKRIKATDYKTQLQEKQKVQVTYGLTGKQMATLFSKVAREKIPIVLEHRLDRVVFLLGFAKSQRIARQMITHGHILVNNKKVTIPSYYVTLHDIVSVRPESRGSGVCADLALRLKQQKPPEWLQLNVEECKGECVLNHRGGELRLPFDIDLVEQYYSR